MRMTYRICNSLAYGGIQEVIRKGYHLIVYKIRGNKIKRDVKNKSCKYGLANNSQRDFKVIVSLTTYPIRFNSIYACLKSLILQEEKPDKILVYLGSDSKDVEMPETMKQFKKYGVEFRIDNEKNLKSHKKYFYAMQEFPEAIIVTADDDIIYPSDWLKSLIDSFRKYPNAVSARRVHLMKRNDDGYLLPYNHWVDQYRKLDIPSKSLFPTGNAGILYPPHCLDERVFDDKAFIKLCFEADDVWLKCMAILKNTPVVWVPNDVVALPEVENPLSGLSETNVGSNNNDRFIKNVMEAYDIPVDAFF